MVKIMAEICDSREIHGICVIFRQKNNKTNSNWEAQCKTNDSDVIVLEQAPACWLLCWVNK